jgi:hypothetical protein
MYGIALAGVNAALLVENLVAVYFFFDGMHMLYDAGPLAGRAVLVMRSLEFVTVAGMAAVTLR